MEKFSEKFQKKVDVWSNIYELTEKEPKMIPHFKDGYYRIDGSRFLALESFCRTLCALMPNESCIGCQLKERLDICPFTNCNCSVGDLKKVEEELFFLGWLLLMDFSKEEIDMLKPYFDVAKNRLNRRREIRF